MWGYQFIPNWRRLVSGSDIINLPLGRANGTIRKSNVRTATDLKLLLNAQRIVEVRAFSGEYNNGLKIAVKEKDLHHLLVRTIVYKQE